MKSITAHLAIVVALAAVVLFTSLGTPRLWDRDEPRNAGCSVEMMARGDLITPVFDGELRTHKPILQYWFMMAAYALFGVSEFAARFWSAVLATGTACLTYGIGRRMFSAEVGLWAAVILLTTLMFDVAARAATPDSHLIFWSTLALFVYVQGTFGMLAGVDGAPQPVRWFPSWPWASAMYAALGMAVLAKGPVGIVLPAAVLGMYLLVQRLPARGTENVRGWNRLAAACSQAVRTFAPGHFLRTCWLMRPITALVVVALVALPWYLAVSWRTDGHWVRGFLLDHNLGRATQALEGHGGSFFYYYPLALLVGFFPWSVFAVPTLLETVRRVRRGEPAKAGFILAVCWIGVYLTLFSLAQTKLPSYITPCYPAVALLVANFVVAWARGDCLCSASWPVAAFACLGLIGLGLGVIAFWAASRYLPGEQWLALIGCVPMLTAAAAYLAWRRARRTQAAVTFALGAAMLVTAIFGWGAVRVDRHREFDTLMAAAFSSSHSPRIGTLGVLEPSWVFYLGQPLDHLFDPELTPHLSAEAPWPLIARSGVWPVKPHVNVWQFLNERPDRYVITTERIFTQLPSVPSDVQVVARAPYFMRGDRLVLLARRVEVAGVAADQAMQRDVR